MGPRRGTDGASRWRRYLGQFHHDRPGITADTLGTARSDGLDPYQWALQPLGDPGRLVDIACGNGPIAARTTCAGWVGFDLSGAELRAARAAGARTLVRADATMLPVASASTPAVVCSMAIMIVQPLDALLAEIRRVLTAEGTAVALLPGGRPLTAGDLYRYGRLLAALRRSHLAYPNDWKLARLRTAAARAGLEVVDDQRRRFELPFPHPAAAHRFVASLYLPGAGAQRRRRAALLAGRWAPGAIGVPVRRLVLRPLPRPGPLSTPRRAGVTWPL